MNNPSYAINNSCVDQKQGGMEMGSRPDDQKENSARKQEHFHNTLENMEIVNELMPKTEDPEIKKKLSEKNDRRQGAIDKMHHDEKDESQFRWPG
jgi:small acid-soluble spore protein tlp